MIDYLRRLFALTLVGMVAGGVAAACLIAFLLWWWLGR